MKSLVLKYNRDYTIFQYFFHSVESQRKALKKGWGWGVGGREQKYS